MKNHILGYNILEEYQEKSVLIKYYVPSFTYEKKSHGFNRMLWAFVALISMFTVGVGVMIVNVLGVYLLDIISTVYTDHMTAFSGGFITLAVLIMLIYGLKFVQSFLVSYKMDGDTIIKGRIQNNALGRSDNVVDEMAARIMVRHKFSSESVVEGNTLINAHGIYELAQLNRNVSFVSEYFDTNLYKKKIYENAILKRETKEV